MGRPGGGRGSKVAGTDLEPGQAAGGGPGEKWGVLLEVQWEAPEAFSEVRVPRQVTRVQGCAQRTRAGSEPASRSARGQGPEREGRRRASATCRRCGSVGVKRPETGRSPETELRVRAARAGRGCGRSGGAALTPTVKKLHSPAT